MLVGTFWGLFDVFYCMTLWKRRTCLAWCYVKSSPYCINCDRVRCMINFCKLCILVHADKIFCSMLDIYLYVLYLKKPHFIPILLQNFNKSWWWRFILRLYTCFNYLHTISNVKLVFLLQSFLLIYQHILPLPKYMYMCKHV